MPKPLSTHSHSATNSTHKKRPQSAKGSAKSKAKKTRALRSRNWRSRPTTPAVAIECMCESADSYVYEYEWSEESIQRQLSYLLPIPVDEVRGDDADVEGSEARLREMERERSGGKCCWHHWPYSHEFDYDYSRYVWCCGGICAYLAASPDVNDMLIDDAVAAESTEEVEAEVRSCEVAGDVGKEMEGGDTSESGRNAEMMELRMVCRDEWDCDFCGVECFCKYQTFGGKVAGCG